RSLRPRAALRWTGTGRPLPRRNPTRRPVPSRESSTLPYHSPPAAVPPRQVRCHHEPIIRTDFSIRDDEMLARQRRMGVVAHRQELAGISFLNQVRFRDRLQKALALGAQLGMCPGDVIPALLRQSDGYTVPGSNDLHGDLDTP